MSLNHLYLVSQLEKNDLNPFLYLKNANAFLSNPVEEK